jgi:hypothetical protein
LLLIMVAYGAYSGARLLARGDVGTAIDNGLAILRLENALWLHAEEPLNDLFTQEAWLGVPSSFAYASLHYIVTPLVLIWLFRWRPLHYRLMRTWLLASTMIGLAGFTLLPTSPPRLLPDSYGFVDSLAQYSGYGWWADDASAPSGMGDFTNQYAAMPSLHVGWSLWCGVALWHYGARRPWVRAAAVGYPLITTVVVMGTANHYLMDALAGAAVMTIGLLLARPLLRLSQRLRERLGTAGPVPGTEHDALPAGPAGSAARPVRPRAPGGTGAARHNGAVRPATTPAPRAPREQRAEHA